MTSDCNLSTPVSLDPISLSPAETYRLLISAVIPRPIAWIVTRGQDNSLNCAPFSFFNAVGGRPPILMVSVGSRGGIPKDTLRNLRESGECVVHIVTEPLAEKMNATSADLAYEINEIELAELRTAASDSVSVPRLADAAIALECRAIQFVPVASTGYTIALLEVLKFHLQPDLLAPDGLIDPEKLCPIARLGRNQYTTLGRVFAMRRPGV